MITNCRGSIDRVPGVILAVCLYVVWGTGLCHAEGENVDGFRPVGTKVMRERCDNGKCQVIVELSRDPASLTKDEVAWFAALGTPTCLRGSVRKVEGLSFAALRGISIRSLWCDGLDLTDDVCNALAELRELESLTLSNVRGTRLSDAGLKRLRAMMTLTTISLFVSEDVFSNGLRGILTLRQLKQINLRWCGRGLVVDGHPSQGKTKVEVVEYNDPPLTREQWQMLADCKSLEYLRLDGDRATGRGLALLRVLPSLRRLSLVDTVIDSEALEALAALTNVEELYLSASAILSSRSAKVAAMPRLRHLALSSTNAAAGLGLDAGLAAWVRACKELRTLELSRARLSPDFLDGLRGSDIRTLVCDLDLLDVEDRLLNVEHLRKLAGLEHLEELRCDGLQADKEGSCEGSIGALSQLRALKKVSFSKQADLPESGIRVLAGLPHLEELDLATEYRGGEVALREALPGLRHLKRLRRLRIGSACARLDMFPDSSPDVRHIDGSDDVRHTNAIAECANLEELELNEQALQDVDLAPLARLAKLRVLRLGYGTQGFTDEGLRALTGMAELRELNLEDVSGISDRGLQILAKVPRLEVLNVRGTRVTDAGVQALFKASPSIKRVCY